MNKASLKQHELSDPFPIDHRRDEYYKVHGALGPIRGVMGGEATKP